jgi:hypothetical protein
MLGVGSPPVVERERRRRAGDRGIDDLAREEDTVPA